MADETKPSGNDGKKRSALYYTMPALALVFTAFALPGASSALMASGQELVPAVATTAFNAVTTAGGHIIDAGLSLTQSGSWAIADAIPG